MVEFVDIVSAPCGPLPASSRTEPDTQISDSEPTAQLLLNFNLTQKLNTIFVNLMHVLLQLITSKINSKDLQIRPTGSNFNYRSTNVNQGTQVVPLEDRLHPTLKQWLTTALDDDTLVVVVQFLKDSKIELQEQKNDAIKKGLALLKKEIGQLDQKLGATIKSSSAQVIILSKTEIEKLVQNDLIRHIHPNRNLSQ